MEDDYHAIARFALFQVGHLSKVGEAFTYEGWRIEIKALPYFNRFGYVAPIPRACVLRGGRETTWH